MKEKKIRPHQTSLTEALGRLCLVMRLRLRLRQPEAAARCGIARLSPLERGWYVPTAETVLKILDGLNATPEERQEACLLWTVMQSPRIAATAFGVEPDDDGKVVMQRILEVKRHDRAS